MYPIPIFKCGPTRSERACVASIVGPFTTPEAPSNIAGCDSGELLLSLESDSIPMAAPEVHHLFHHPIADHSFSADKQTLAVAHENNVELYARAGNKFTLQDELKGHDKTVTSVDIAPSSGRIVTCSQGASSLKMAIVGCTTRACRKESDTCGD